MLLKSHDARYLGRQLIYAFPLAEKGTLDVLSGQIWLDETTHRFRGATWVDLTGVLCHEKMQEMICARREVVSGSEWLTQFER